MSEHVEYWVNERVNEQLSTYATYAWKRNSAQRIWTNADFIDKSEIQFKDIWINTDFVDKSRSQSNKISLNSNFISL